MEVQINNPEQYYVYYPLAILIVLVAIGAVFNVMFVKRHIKYVVAFGVLVLIFKSIPTIFSARAGFDYGIFWEAGHTVLQGENPYRAVHNQMLLNPPTALPLFTILALVPKQLSFAIWTILNIMMAGILVFLAYRALLAQEGMRSTGTSQEPRKFELSPAALYGLSAAVALSLPSHFSIKLGQLTFFITICLLLALYSQARKRKWAAGIALGFATIKITMMLPFLMLFLRKSDKRIWIALITSVLILSIIIPGPFGLFTWLSDNLSNIQALSQAGRTNDYSVTAVGFNSLLGLDSAFYHLGITNRSIISFCQLLSLLLLGLWILRESVWSGRWSRGMACSIVALYCVIFLYHRIYDLVILVLPLVYAASRVQMETGRSRWLFASAMLAILAAMYIHQHIGVLVVGLVYHMSVLGRLAAAVILPLVTWLILASIFLLAAGHSVKADSPSV